MGVSTMKIEWSLNELDLMVRRATRGSGLDWGIAEEAGKAIRWLCSFGFDGVSLLLEELTEANKETALVNISKSVWTGSSALLIGIALIDRVGLSLPHRIKGLKNPLFLAPFLAQRAAAEKRSLTLDWTQGSISITSSGRVSVHGNLLSQNQVCIILSEQDDVIFGNEIYYIYRALITQDKVDQLREIAHRTYVPNSLSNQAVDAGGGLIDND